MIECALTVILLQFTLPVLLSCEECTFLFFASGLNVPAVQYGKYVTRMNIIYWHSIKNWFWVASGRSVGMNPNMADAYNASVHLLQWIETRSISPRILLHWLEADVGREAQSCYK